jgi:hypothetical protein
MLYTPEEYKELKEVIDGITTHIPEHRMGYIWNNYNKITGNSNHVPVGQQQSIGELQLKL